MNPTGPVVANPSTSDQEYPEHQADSHSEYDDKLPERWVRRLGIAAHTHRVIKSNGHRLEIRWTGRGVAHVIVADLATTWADEPKRCVVSDDLELYWERSPQARCFSYGFIPAAWPKTTSPVFNVNLKSVGSTVSVATGQLNSTGSRRRNPRTLCSPGEWCPLRRPRYAQREHAYHTQHDRAPHDPPSQGLPLPHFLAAFGFCLAALVAV